jgi:hypothetical protein
MDPKTAQNLKVDKRLCCVCDKPLIGRSDKVFCDINCKNKYHSEIRKHTKSAASVSSAIMYKNYQILCLLLGTNCSKYSISKKELQKRGFCFEVVSGITITPYGIKHELFEFSWYYSKNNQVIVKLDREQSIISPFMYKRWERTLEDKQTTKVSTVPKTNINTHQDVRMNC